ncbi:MAG: cytochrome P450 [bacterium]|nr:cytochrome P450 [bacterium]
MTALDNQATSTSFDLFRLPPDYYRDPDWYLSQLRAHDPVHANSDGTVLMTRYTDVLGIWRSEGALVDKSDQFAEKFGPGPLLEHHTTTMLFRDPPDHGRLRNVVTSFFTQEGVARVQDTVHSHTIALLDRAGDLGELDFFQEIAMDLPIAVICALLGLPESDADFLHHHGVQVLFPLNPGVPQSVIDAGHDAVRVLCDYLDEHLTTWIDCSGRTGDEHVVARLASAVVAGSITRSDALHMLIVLMNGGHETTANLLTVGLYELMRQRDQLALLSGNSSLAPTAVEELLRYVSPLQLQGRRLTQPFEASDGSVLAPGTEVVISQASGNRDDTVFTDAHKIDVARKPNRHVAFGRGIHACIGQYLTRTEVLTFLPAFLQRFPDVHAVGNAEFVPNARFRSLRSLPISVS